MHERGSNNLDQLSPREQLTFFRKRNGLGEDSGFDDLVLNEIKQELNQHHLREDYQKLVALIYPEHEQEQRDKLSSHLERQLYIRVYNRLLSHAITKQYNLYDYFNLTDTSGKFTDGERAQDVDDAVLAEVNFTKKLIASYNQIPTVSTTIKYESPIIINPIGRDIMDTITDASHGAMMTGQIVNQQTIISNLASHKSITPIQNAASSVFTIGGLVVSAVNFMLIPFYYLYRKSRDETLKFENDERAKMIIAGISVIVGVIGIVIPAAGIGILLAFGSIGMIASSIALGKYIYDRIKLSRMVRDNKQLISELEAKIKTDKENAQHIREHIDQLLRQDNPDPRVIDNLILRLHNLNIRYKENCTQLKQAKMTEETLTVAGYHQKPAIKAINSAATVLVAATFLVGGVLMLTPFTAPIGATMLVAAAVTALAVMIGTKVHQFWARRKAQQLAMANKTSDSDFTNDTESKEKKHELHHESTLNLYESLFADKQQAQGQLRIEYWSERIGSRLDQLVKAQSRQGMLHFFLNTETYCRDHGINSDQLKAVFDDVNRDILQQAFSLYRNAIEEVNNTSLHLLSKQRDMLAHPHVLDKVYADNNIAVTFEKKSWEIHQEKIQLPQADEQEQHSPKF